MAATEAAEVGRFGTEHFLDGVDYGCMRWHGAACHHYITFPCDSFLKHKIVEMSKMLGHRQAVGP